MRTVFVAGCGRSGTTLLASMLGSDAQHITTPESKFALEVYQACMREHGVVQPGAALRRIREHWSFRIWKLQLTAADEAALAQSSSYAELLGALVARYAAATGKPGAEVWIDHTPFVLLNTHTVFELYPEAKLLHIVRDGRAVAASLMKLDWGPSSIDTAAYWWVWRIAHGLAAESAYGPERVMRVRYEDLVREPHATLAAVCGFAGLQFRPAMIDGSGFRVPGYTAHQHKLVGERPRAERAQAWHNELTQRQIEIFESVAADILSALDYRLVFGARARPATRWEKLRSGALEVALTKVINRMRSQQRQQRFTTRT